VQVIASCPEGGSRIKDPWGRPLPACMVMERGEALDLWMERAQPDKYMAFSVRPLATSSSDQFTNHHAIPFFLSTNYVF
jgi:hypothetical protein